MEAVLERIAPVLRRRIFELVVCSVGGLGVLIGWAADSWLLAGASIAGCAGAFWLRRQWAGFRERMLERKDSKTDGENNGSGPGRSRPGSLASASTPLEDIVRPNPRRARPIDGDNPAGLIEQMIEEGRFALLLRPEIVGNLDEHQTRRALESLDNAMALTPEGMVLLHTWRASAELEGDALSDEHLVRVEAFYLDRFPVSNSQYLRFIEAGGYEQMSLWDPDVWSGVLDFVDRTGQPGPGLWEHGGYPRGMDDHPVVGVSWYEASAYSRWLGKRLPTDAEWVKTAAWPVGGGNKPSQRRYPWGDAMDHRFANLWGTQIGTTVPVDEYEEGASVSGVYQLIGNVWEWTHSNFGAWDESSRRIEIDGLMKSIRGGAFDTYFDNQATCQFQSGDSAMSRKHNIGFRCALGLCDLAPELVSGWESVGEISPEENESGALESVV